MDDKKICFIMCTNDELYAGEAMYFINNLNVPEGFTIDVISVTEAKSMTSGYNEGMAASDAKYKVYLHQDVMIVEKDFIYKLLDIFQDETIGMIGMVGAPKLPENKVMWYSRRVGKIYANNIFSTTPLDFGNDSEKYDQVEAIDGLLMATQYDVRWRDDILDKWDFYDVSQSLEFIRAGYKVVVPYMDTPWVIHDDGFVELDNYYEQRRKFKKEYYQYNENILVENKDYGADTEEYIVQEEQYRKEWKKLYDPHRDNMIRLAEECLDKKTVEAEKALIDYLSREELVKKIHENNEFCFVVIMMDILAKERDASINDNILKWADNLQGIIQVIRQVRFLLWEIEFLDSDEAVELLLGFKQDVKISTKALAHIIMISSYDRNKVLNKLRKRM
ncbi:MAG: glycosyltransferase family protein [Lachnospiraceae bacterium]|nr:glycosyltransferase family protein [Lachnospiraceae bacterium]